MIDPQQLHELLVYHPKTGKFFWKERNASHFQNSYLYKPAQFHCDAWNRIHAHKEAFCTPHGRGYLCGEIFGKKYKTHRVAWAMHYGAWPSTGIDHIDGNPSNNKIVNLRSVPQSINGKNLRMPTNNTSGVVGVYWHKPERKWLSLIICDGRRIHLGQFNAFEDAVDARLRAERQYGFHENHGRAHHD